MAKNPSFRPDFGPYGLNLEPKNILQILPLLDVRHCCKLSLNAISRKTNEPNLRKWQKTHYFWVRFWPKFGPPKFCFKYLVLLVTRYHGLISSCTISEKTNDPILRKLSNRQMDRPTERRKDE